MAELFSRAGVLFAGLGVLLLLLLGARSEIASQDVHTISIVTPMVESLEDGQCLNSVCINGLTFTDPITGNIETIRVGAVHPEAIFYSPDYSMISYHRGSSWHVLDLETRQAHLVASDVIQQNRTTTGFATILMDWSPDSTRIAYNSQNGINIVDVVTGERRLMSHLIAEQSLEWSPDGTHLLFSGANARGKLDLFSLDLTTGEHINLTSNFPYSYDGIWLPDGSQIVFVMSGRSLIGPGDLFIMDADGTNVERLTRDHRAYKWRPRWILNNTGIFYWALDDYQLDLPTGELVRLEINNKSIGWDISPDGTQRVTVQSIDSLRGDYLLTIYDFRTQESYDLPLKTYHATYPEWGS